MWWYDPNYFAPIKAVNFGNDIEKISRFLIFIRRKLSKINYREQLENIIRLYYRSLNEYDWSTSFIRLWQVLEAATNTQKDGYKTTIERTAFLFSNYEFHKSILNQLRQLRNSLVHQAFEPSTIESNLVLLKNYVEQIILFHLNLAGNFKSIEDSAIFLGLPHSKDEILLKIQLLKKALKLRK